MHARPLGAAGARTGRHVFTARTIDRAGNASAWSEPIEFFVPTQPRPHARWKKQLDTRYFGGDALRPRSAARASCCPAPRSASCAWWPRRDRVGKVGSGRPAGLARRSTSPGPRTALQQYTVIDRYSGIRTGRITIETLSSKPVVIDAVVARPNTFPDSQ